MTFDGTHINFIIAFFGGLVTFFASCLLPLVPTYIAYLSGISFRPGKLTLSEEKVQKREILVNSILFTLGFISVFMILGLTASSVGLLLRRNREVIQVVGGAFLMLVGLFMFGLFESDFLYRDRRINFNYEIIKKRKLKSFVFGLTFGFAWSPCIGPVLGVILFWASQAATMLKGVLLLLSYGLGIGVPFILIGIFFEKLGPKIIKSNKVGKIINIVAALVIFITGLLLLIGKMGHLTSIIMRMFNFIPHGL